MHRRGILVLIQRVFTTLNGYNSNPYQKGSGCNTCWSPVSGPLVYVELLPKPELFLYPTKIATFVTAMADFPDGLRDLY